MSMHLVPPNAFHDTTEFVSNGFRLNRRAMISTLLGILCIRRDREENHLCCCYWAMNSFKLTIIKDE